MMQKLRWLFKFVCLGIGHADGKQSGRVRSWQAGAHTRNCRTAPRRGRWARQRLDVRPGEPLWLQCEGEQWRLLSAWG
jgi:hypothetical protein